MTRYVRGGQASDLVGVVRHLSVAGRRPRRRPDSSLPQLSDSRPAGRFRSSRDRSSGRNRVSARSIRHPPFGAIMAPEGAGSRAAAASAERHREILSTGRRHVRRRAVAESGLSQCQISLPHGQFSFVFHNFLSIDFWASAGVCVCGARFGACRVHHTSGGLVINFSF